MIWYLRTLFVVTLLYVLAPPAQAREIFINPGGSVVGDGSSTHPINTIQDGVELANPKGGDVLVISGGHYTSPQVINKPVILRASIGGPIIIGQCDSESMNAVIQIDHIKVLDEADGLGNAEPYIWPLFFKIDFDSLEPFLPQLAEKFGFNDISCSNSATTNNSWLYAPNGEHENVGSNGEDGWDAGDTISVPSSVGMWDTRMNWPEKCSVDTLSISVPVPKDMLSLGVVIVLLEEDGFPSSSAIQESYQEFATTFSTEILQAVESLIRDIEVSDFVTQNSEGSTHINATNIGEEAETRIENVLKDRLTEPWFLVPVGWAIDIDDFIGVKMFMWTWNELETEVDLAFSTTWDDTTGSEDGSYQIYGTVRSRAVCGQ